MAVGFETAEAECDGQDTRLAGAEGAVRLWYTYSGPVGNILHPKFILVHFLALNQPGKGYSQHL